MHKSLIMWRRQCRRMVQHGSVAGLSGWRPNVVLRVPSRSVEVLLPAVVLRWSVAGLRRPMPELQRRGAVARRLHRPVDGVHEVPGLLKVMLLRVARHLTRLQLRRITRLLGQLVPKRLLVTHRGHNHLLTVLLLCLLRRERSHRQRQLLPIGWVAGLWPTIDTSKWLDTAVRCLQWLLPWWDRPHGSRAMVAGRGGAQRRPDLNRAAPVGTPGWECDTGLACIVGGRRGGAQARRSRCRAAIVILLNRAVQHVGGSSSRCVSACALPRAQVSKNQEAHSILKPLMCLLNCTAAHRVPRAP